MCVCWGVCEIVTRVGGGGGAYEEEYILIGRYYFLLFMYIDLVLICLFIYSIYLAYKKGEGDVLLERFSLFFLF